MSTTTSRPETAEGTPMAPAPILDYARARKEFAESRVRQDEVPVEYDLSLPLPTLRFGRPVFAGFAAPAQRTPGGGKDVAPPDYWWAIDARSARVVLFARTDVVPMQDGAWFGRVGITVGGTIEGARQALRFLDETMDAVADAFLLGGSTSPLARRDAREALRANQLDQLADRYRALAPDFLQWLDA